MTTKAVVTRRALLGSVAACAFAQRGDDLVDYHAHIDAAPTLDGLFEISRNRGVKLGVVEHAGNKKDHRYRGLIADDADLDRYMARLKGRPCFTGIQAEGLDWMHCFSKAAIARLDYVLTDALTMPQPDGTLVRLWTPAAKVENKQDFMERYTAHHLKILTTEPIDILANPLFLPEQIQQEAATLWTDERMRRIITAAVEHGVAFEINSRFRLPSVKFLKMAKAAGAKFSFGSNILGAGVGDLGYGREMVKELRLERTDLFAPAPPGRKPVQVRRLAQSQTDEEIERRLQSMLGPGKGFNNLDAAEGAYLRNLVLTLNARRVLEVGTSTGYSGIWLAMGLRRTGGRLITIEYNEGRHATARENFRVVGLTELIDARLADALQEVPKVEGPLDLVFLDARQMDNLRYFEMVRPKMRKGGIVVAHNVKSHPQLMPDFLARIQSDPGVTTEIVTPGWQGFSVTVIK